MTHDWKKLGNGNFLVKYVNHRGRVQRKLNPAKGEPIYTAYIEQVVLDDNQGTKCEPPILIVKQDFWKIQDGKDFVAAEADKLTYMTYNMLGEKNADGTRKMFPMKINTPYYCDPSSEAYHCM